MKAILGWFREKGDSIRACEEIRYAMAIFGYDISELSDDEIISQTIEFNRRCSEAWYRLSMSASEVADRLAAIAKAM